MISACPAWWMFIGLALQPSTLRYYLALGSAATALQAAIHCRANSFPELLWHVPRAA
ncbi:hypothetical protein I79_008573 [Cricetulus griseus]|uniref:Uncharacterized protein n=1 Tax=Cricetulus griseus TaxID=10029 RepID=G3HDI9_CRIGR|nr:hypothetical protein I79_008573 [Cricetulus griseus]